MKKIITSSHEVNRREFVKGVAIAPFVVSSLLTDTLYGRDLSWKDIKYVLKLNFVRFLSGLVFDVVEVVVVNYLKNSHGGYDSFGRTYLTSESNFDNPLYKKAVIDIHPVRYGMSDEEYRKYKEEKNKIILSREEDNVRYEKILKEFVDTKTRIALVGDNSSQKVTSKFDVNDFYNIKYVVSDHQDIQKTYQNLLEKTEVGVFDKMVV